MISSNYVWRHLKISQTLPQTAHLPV